VWKTDSSGNHGWREDANTTYSAGIGISLSGTTFSHADTNTNISVDTSYGPTANVTQSVKNTATFKVPQITLDQFGHVKSVTERTITVADTDNNTTYTFTDGINCFYVTPSNGITRAINVTPSIENNITGSGEKMGIAVFTNTHTLGHMAIIDTKSDKNQFLKITGEWDTPHDTKY
jgi:hypothetical protein